MKISRIIFLLIITLSFSLKSYSQIWIDNVKSNKPTLKDVQDQFYDYWKNKPIEKGKGYKPFKRWEWFMSNRLMPDGTLPPSDITIKNYTQYLQGHSQGANRTTSSIANWTFNGPTTSPGGYNGLGRINCIAFHPTDVNTFWVGTPAGGLWKTTTGGNSWTTVTDNLPVLGVSDIAIDPTNPDIMYIATGDGDAAYSLYSNSTFAGDTKSIGILKSTDGGSTWNTTGLSWAVTDAILIRRLIINPLNPQILIAATSDGIYKTTDAGFSWSNVQSGYFMDAEFKPSNPSIVYAATYYTGAANAQIFRSLNSGTSWTSVISIPNVRRMNLAVTPNSPSIVDVLCCDLQGGLAGMWRSSNSGASFSRYFSSDSSNNFLHNSYNASGTGGQGDYDLAYAINPTNATEIWLGGVNLWNSINGGATWNLKTQWTDLTSGVAVVHADKHFLAFHPLQSGTIFDCNDGGLYKSDDGGATWTDLTNGLGISQIYRLGTSVTVPNKVIFGLQDNGTKELNNGSFLEQTGGDGMECIIDYTDDNIEYATYVQGLIYKTTDGFNYSTIVSNDGSGVNEPGEWVTPYLMHPTNHNILIVGKSQVYQSNDGGINWSQLGTITGADGNVIALAYALSNPQVIYASTRTQIFKTSDGGNAWTLLNGTTQYTSPNTCITVSPADENILYVTEGGYVSGNKVWEVTTTNSANTIWQNISGTLPNVPVNCIVYQYGSNGIIYIGTDVGVFYRDATMSDWGMYQAGLPNVVVTELEISYNNNKLWAATFGRGLWNSDLCFINASASGSTDFCQGGSVTLTSSSLSGNQWYKNSVPLNGATGVTYSATSTGDYTVVSSSGSCSSAVSNAITVTANTYPSSVITPSGTASFCTGGSVTLNANTGTGFTYQWKKNSVIIPGAIASSYSASTIGSYTLVVTNASNCSSVSSAVQVSTTSVLATPTISASGPTTFCQGGSVTLTSSSLSGNQWYKNSVAITGATGVTYSASATGNYTVVSSSGSCSSAVSNGITVTTNAYPTAVITPAGTTTFCSGGSVTLNANTGTGLSYQWKKDGVDISGATSSSYTASLTGSYTLAVTNASNCSTVSSAVQVTTTSVPATPTLSALGTTTFCQGGGVVLTSSSSSANQWYKNAVAIAGATGVTYTATATGNYTVVVTSGLCSSAVSNAISVTVNAVPSVPTISWNGSQFLTSASGVTYQWYNGVAISGAILSTYTPTSIGTYSLQVSSNGCSSMSDNFTLVATGINATLSLSPYTAQIYPNPASKEFAVKFAETPGNSINLQLLNNLGIVVKSIKTKSMLTSIKVNNLPPGVYFIKIIGGFYNQVRKIEIIR